MITLSQQPSFTLPASALLNLGGYTGFLPDEWQAGLDAAIRRILPAAGVPAGSPGVDTTSWRTNDCIFTALRQALFHQFGILLPEDSVFKLYNRSGEGIMPHRILAAITAVIEPVGVEVERIVVTDPVLREAVGGSPLVVDAGSAAEIDGRAGVCMINIGPAYSHAFFWERMDACAVQSPQFRMAVLLRRIEALPGNCSVFQSLADYRRLVKTALAASNGRASCDLVKTTYEHLDALLRFANDREQQGQAGFRDQLLTRLDQIAAPLDDLFRGQTGQETRAALHAPVMLRSILREAADLS